jgi:parallel beta-helix repeat protein
MKKFPFIPLGLAFVTANMAFAADEIHYTVTGQNSVTFDWRGTAVENSIGFGLSPGAYTQVTAITPTPVPNSSQGPFWEAKLAGLKENSLYYYSIGSGPERTFRTPPVLGSSGFTVYAQGDIGDTTNYFNVGAVQDLIANGQPALVLGLGNLARGVSNGKAAIDQHFNDVMAWSKEAAYMPAWGDQDWKGTGNVGFANYRGRFDLPNPQTSPDAPLAGGEDWYWYDYGNSRFISVPDYSSAAWADWNTKADALMAQAQTDPKIQYIVTFGYDAAYSSGHYPGLATLKGLLDALGDKHNKYVLNLNARSRNYERSHPQHGVVHVTAGIGGTWLAQDGTCLWLTCTKPAWSAFRAMHQGALKLNFTATGIEGSFICGPTGGGKNDVTCAKGSVVDSFKIAAPVSAGGTSDSGVVTTPSTGANSCAKTSLGAEKATLESGYSYFIENIFGTRPDANNFKKSTLRLFENGKEIGPAHSSHNEVRTKGLGRFSHWGDTNGAESLRFSASDNTDPTANGKTYTYCLTSDGAAPDAQAPSIPLNLKVAASSPTEIDLSWSASTDNEGVTGYKIYRNNTQIDKITSTTYTNSVLTPGTSYTYTIIATDAAGNDSVASTAGTATTLAAETTSTTDSAATASCAPAPTSSLVVSVKNKGARGNGSANDTAAFQAAINQVAGTGGTVLVPDGTYMIDAVKRLYLKSNMTFRMTSGAVLKAMPNASRVYSLLRVASASNVNIIGGKLQGERAQHRGTTGEWGHGIELNTGKNVVIEGVTSRDMWGDGFYLGFNSSNVTVCSVTADNNRRQGMTITAANGVVIKNSIFKNTNGTLPMSGIQIEPNANETANNVKILNSQMFGNKGWGIKSVRASSGSSISNVTIDGNTIENNSAPGKFAEGINITNASGHRITNNIVKNNLQDGIVLTYGAKNNIVTGNTVTGNGTRVATHNGTGIMMWDRSTNNTVTGNVATGNRKQQIRDYVGGNTVTPNTVN